MKAKRLIALTLVALSAASFSGCKKRTDGGDDGGGGGSGETSYFSFSIGLASGANVIDVPSGGTKTDAIQVFDNGVDTAGRSYSFTSSDENVATIDASGNVTFKDPGETPVRVNFYVTENKSHFERELKKDILVSRAGGVSNGGYNYSGGTSKAELDKRAEILGKLEKYAMDSHLTGITLFDNGGYVKYANRVKIPTAGQEYIEGYGFGILTEGELDGNLPGSETYAEHPDYYHSSIAQDSLKINQYSATGSQVSDLAGYITSSYWGTRLDQSDTSKYEWYPLLATDSVKKPTVAEDGTITYAGVATRNSEPIPMEPANATNLYRKWRVYVKTSGLRYTTVSSKLAAYNGREVTIDDYEFAYQLLFTQSNNIIRGTEMANDTSYGIKGAKRYYNATKSMTDKDEIAAKWKEFKDSGKLGIATGSDTNGSYIDIELINAIDSFTAMYTLSSNLVSPLPRSFFVDGVIGETMQKSIAKYGLFNDGSILDYTLCLGPYTLTKWVKLQEIVFARNDGWFEVSSTRYKIPGVYYRVVDTSTDTEKNWKRFEDGNLDSAGVPSSKVEEQIGKEGVRATKGDATFKLNVNSCTQEEWNKLFGPDGKWPADGSWEIKPWMSNQDFLDGLFYSIDRQAFAKKRGVTPSVNYFSDAYQMRNAEGGSSYNKTQAHLDAVKGYSENFGYNLDKAIDCFRNAVQQLSKTGDIVLGESKEKPTTINIHIRWMYPTDIKEYGNDIKSYFEKAFNNDAVCGGRVKLEVKQEAVTNWEDVYNVWMMQGRFDLGFGAISGNTYNPLNFLEVLKSDNSSSFTLNWGPDTSKVDEKNPIIYDGKKWSFDALWEVADHGGIVENGEKIDPVKRCYNKRPTKLDGTGFENDLYNGFDVVIPTEFAEYEGSGSGSATFDASRLDLYIHGYGNETLAEVGSTDEDLEGCTIVYDKAKKEIRVHVTAKRAKQVSDIIKEAKGYKDTDKEEWHKNPFIVSKLGENEVFEFELYYSLKIAGGSASINYTPVATA